MSGQWYLIYRYRWIGLNLVRDREPIDGVFASHADAAVQIAAGRNEYKTDARLNWFGPMALNAVFCVTAPQRVRASDLDCRHTCYWWSRTDFADWMKLPAYSGDQDKNLRT